jgi:hypothetical protein
MPRFHDTHAQRLATLAQQATSASVSEVKWLMATTQGG